MYFFGGVLLLLLRLIILRFTPIVACSNSLFLQGSFYLSKKIQSYMASVQQPFLSPSGMSFDDSSCWPCQVPGAQGRGFTRDLFMGLWLYMELTASFQVDNTWRSDNQVWGQYFWVKAWKKTFKRKKCESVSENALIVCTYMALTGCFKLPEKKKLLFFLLF